MTTVDAKKSYETIQGILALFGHDVCVLFDTCSHLFVASRAVCHIPIPRITLPYYLIVTTSGDVVLIGGDIYRDCEIRVHDKDMLADLVALDIRDFNLILGMD